MERYSALGFSYRSGSHWGKREGLWPPGDICQHLEVFLVVTAGEGWGGRMSLAANWWRPGMLLDTFNDPSKQRIVHPQNVNGSEVEKPCPIGINVSKEEWLKIFELQLVGTIESQLFSVTQPSLHKSKITTSLQANNFCIFICIYSYI